MPTPTLKITRLTGFGRGKAISCTDAVVLLGTEANCAVQFDATWDRTVSAQHAKLVWENEAWWVVDASRDGTWLQGQRVTKSRLEPGQVLEIGKGGPTIRLEWEPPLAAPAQATAAGMVERTAAPITPQASVPAPAYPSRAAERRPGLPMSAYVAVVGIFVVATAIALWFRSPGSPDEALATVAAKHERAVGLVVAVARHGGSGQPTAVGTAFAVGGKTWATTAQVAKVVEEVLRGGGSAYVAVNRNPEERIKITLATAHPRFGERELNFEGKAPAVPAYDVGIVSTEEKAAKTWSIASRRTLEAVGAGTRVAGVGFGSGADVRAPVAAMQSGIVAAITDWWAAPTSEPAKRTVLQLGAGSPVGSPIFDENGDVLAIAGGRGAAQRIDVLRGVWSDYP